MPCFEKIGWYDAQHACQMCGEWLEAEGSQLCNGCRHVEWNFDRSLYGVRYEGRLVKMISDYKFRGAHHLAAPLAFLLASSLSAQSAALEFDCVVPVPLHPKRMRQRGFNQSLLLALKLIACPSTIRENALVRIRYTTPQVHLKGRERLSNLNDAFLTRDIPPGASVLLLDDVMTTGATLNEAAKALKRAGVRRVTAVALARKTDSPEPSSEAGFENTLSG